MFKIKFNKKGQAQVEYALYALAVVIVVGAVVGIFQTRLQTLATDAVNQMPTTVKLTNNAIGQAPGDTTNPVEQEPPRDTTNPVIIPPPVSDEF